MKSKIFTFVIIVAGLFAYTKFFGNADQREIRNVIARFEESLEYEKPLQPFVVLKRLKTIEKLLAPGFSARSVNDETEKKVDIVSIKEGALVAARYFSFIDIFRVPAIIEVNGDFARASFHTTVSGKDTRSEEFKELIAVEMNFIHREGEWLCQSISGERLTPED